MVRAEVGACPEAQALHVSLSWPHAAFAFSPERELQSTSLHGGSQGGSVLTDLSPVACVVPASRGDWERVRDLQGKQVFLGLDGGQERSPGIGGL